MGPQCELTFDASANHLETHWSCSCSFEEKISSSSPSEEDPRFASFFYSSIHHNQEGPGCTPYGTH